MSDNIEKYKEMYAGIAASYDHDPFNAIPITHQMAMEQIKESGYQFQDVLDAPLGTGNFLEIFHQEYPRANLFGIDISQEMMAIAKTKIPVDVKVGDIAHLSEYYHQDAFDFVAAHFVMSYLPCNELVKEVASVLRMDGMFSIISTFPTAFPALQALLKECLTPQRYQQYLSTIILPDRETLKQVLKKFGFKVFNEKIATIPIIYPSLNALIDYSKNSGFFTDRALGFTQDEMNQIIEKFQGKISFPVSDCIEVQVLLAQKSTPKS